MSQMDDVIGYLIHQMHFFKCCQNNNKDGAKVGEKKQYKKKKKGQV